MATGGVTKSSTKEFEERKHPGCSSCSEDGDYTAAGHYCIECELYFCGKCVKYHNKMPALKSHQVNAVANSSADVTTDCKETGKQRDVLSESVKCPLHHGQCIDTFCKEHDEVCCGTYALVKHRKCTTEKIATTVKDFKFLTEENETKEELNSLLTKLEPEMKKRTDNLNSIEQKKLENIEVVDTYEAETVAKIKKLADKSREAIRSKYAEGKSAISNDVDTLKAAVTTTKQYVKSIESPSDNDIQSFIDLKSIKMGSRDTKALLQGMNAEWKEKILIFNIDKKFKTTVFEQASIGQLGSDFLEYRATYSGNFRAIGDDSDIFWGDICIIDMCFTDCGDLVIGDLTNKKVKRFNSNLQFKDSIACAGEPTSVCKIGVNEIAVRIHKGKVLQQVSVGETMKMMATFKLKGGGYGMAYDSRTEELYACEENKVSVYSKTGNLLRTFSEDANGTGIFTACRQIVLSENQQNIFVTDMKKGLIVLDQNGSVKMEVTMADVKDAWLLCHLPGQITLVDGETSRAIVQLDKYGKQLRNLLDLANVPSRAYCAVYDQRCTKLLVAGIGQYISTYNILL